MDNSLANSIIRRGYLYLEDHDWVNATKYFDNALDAEPENPQAYIGALLAELQLEKESDLGTAGKLFFENNNYKKALRFADEEYSKKLKQYHMDNVYYMADKCCTGDVTEDDYKTASHLFMTIAEYRDARERSKYCLETAKRIKNENCYVSAKKMIESTDVKKVKEGKTLLETIKDYKDTADLLLVCDRRIAELTKQKERENKKKAIIIAVCAIVATVFVFMNIRNTTIANNKRAEIIYHNMIGRTYKGEKEDDNGFMDDYYNNSLSPYHIYWLDTEKISLTFNQDGTVYYKCISESVALTEVNGYSPNDYYNTYDFTYSGFDIRITLTGEVYLDLGGSSYALGVRADDEVVTSIRGYDDVTLTNYS